MHNPFDNYKLNVRHKSMSICKDIPWGTLTLLSSLVASTMAHKRHAASWKPYLVMDIKLASKWTNDECSSGARGALVGWTIFCEYRTGSLLIWAG